LLDKLGMLSAAALLRRRCADGHAGLQHADGSGLLQRPLI
jgi:hypothetical protein